MFTFTHVLYYVAPLTMLGCSFIIVTFYAHPALRANRFKLVRNLAISDFGYIGSVAFVQAGAPNPDGVVCTAQAFAHMFFDLASMFWTAIMSAWMYRAIILGARGCEGGGGAWPRVRRSAAERGGCRPRELPWRVAQPPLGRLVVAAAESSPSSWPILLLIHRLVLHLSPRWRRRRASLPNCLTWCPPTARPLPPPPTLPPRSRDG